jgi:hypothetical protein
LKKYGFGKSRGYFLPHDSKSYGSKAVAGAAHGNIGSGFQPLSASEFSGDDKTAAKSFRALRFTVLEPSDSKPAGIPFEVGKTPAARHPSSLGRQERGGISTPAAVPFRRLLAERIRLNGCPLALSAADELPTIAGAPTTAIAVTFAQATITFLAVTEARNEACQ